MLQTQEWEPRVELALYADDSALFTRSPWSKAAAKRMQHQLDLIPAWLDEWRMAVNASKSAAMTTGRSKKLPPKLILAGQTIAWVNKTSYLGCCIDRCLSMVAHVDATTTAARTTRAILRPVLSSRLPLKTKIGVYKSYVRSRLPYAAPAWYALCAPTQRTKLQTVQNKALRYITDAGRFVTNKVIHRDLKMQFVEDFVGALARAMFGRADRSDHPARHCSRLHHHLRASHPGRRHKNVAKERTATRHCAPTHPQAHTSKS
jgi:hypothetical protein